MYETFENREQASVAAADIITDAVNRRLEAQSDASIVLSGGSSPVRTFELLAERNLPWADIHVTLSDERWVPPTDEDSNERLLQEHLFNAGDAAAATFHPLYAEGTSPPARSAELDEALRMLPFPFAAALLGMGEDGHFASLFPDADNLDEGLDVDSLQLAIPVTTSASPHARVSLTLSALSRSDSVVLLIFGEAKLEVLKRAVEEPDAYPVGQLLRQKRAPVRVLWAP